MVEETKKAVYVKIQHEQPKLVQYFEESTK